MDTSIYYKKKLIGKLNSLLIEQQGINEESVELLKQLHVKLHLLFLKMKRSKKSATLKTLASELENLEFELQDAWGFGRDRNKHSYWYKVPHCSCPKLDNIECWGTNWRYHNLSCMVHGK